MFSKAILIFSLISVAFATPYITTPTAATTYTGGQKDALVAWMNVDDGKAFGLSSISIYVGNAIKQTQLQVLNPSVDVSTTLNITFSPDPSIGPDSSEYFIRVQSLSAKDNTSLANPLQSFSAKFTLNHMSGNFSSSIQAEISGQSTAPLGAQTSSGASSPTSSPALTSTGTSKSPTNTSSTTSATAKPSSGAMGLKAGWAGLVFGAVVGVTMF